MVVKILNDALSMPVQDFIIKYWWLYLLVIAASTAYYGIKDAMSKHKGK